MFGVDSKREIEMSAVIDVADLKKSYNKNNTLVLKGLSFQVKKGQCFGLLGPNGAGKSTTLEILQGLKKPTSGKVSLFGMDWKDNEKQIRMKIGGLLQSNSLYGRTKVKEAVRLFASFYKDPMDVDELIERFGLTDKANAWLDSLSGGQKQRVFLAMTIVGKPELIFLDEPTTGLDPTSRQSFWEIIKSLKEEGMTVILTTHYMDEADYLCDELLIIEQGKVIESGTPDAIIHRTFTDPVIREPRKATLNDVFLKLTGHDILKQETSHA